METCKFLQGRRTALALALLLGTGCAEASNGPARDAASSGEDAGSQHDGGTGPEAEADAAPGVPRGERSYAWGSLFFGTEDATSYVALLASLDPQTIDYRHAREFSGSADLWVHEGAVFVTDREALSIRKFQVVDRALVEQDEISFAAYGLTDFGFWLNKFVSRTKAYLANGAHEYIVWNPETMEISGTLPLPELAARAGFKPFPGYMDRSALLRGTRLYHALYWTDDDYFGFTPDSRIVVVDTQRDEVLEVLEAPCPGLDFATRDEQGDLYFSSWIFAPGGAALLEQPATCIVKVGADDAPVKAFEIAALTDGRQGGALRYVGGGRALLSVLHDDNASSEDVREVTYGANWRFWSYDFASGAASPLESIPWNAGAVYAADVDGDRYLLVPAGDYSATTLYRLGEGDPERVFEADGWTTRLFAIQGQVSDE